MSLRSVYLEDSIGIMKAQAEWYQECPFKTIPTFQAIQNLGKGAFSTVVKVRCEGREWALKQTSNPREAGFIGREAALLRSLNLKEPRNQEYVVQAIALLTLQDHPMLMMKLYKGGDLLGRVSNMKGGLSCASTLTIANQLLGALAFLKEEKIIHRDLKLANIFCGEGNEVTLGDFGFSMQEGDKQELSILCGTPKAMSPELLQAYNDAAEFYPYASSSDVWAAGCVLFQVFSGFQLFPGEQVLGWVPRLQFQQKMLPTELDPLLFNISRKKSLGSRDLLAFNKALKGMLELDPAQRLAPEDAKNVLFGQEPFVMVEKEDLPCEDNQEDSIGSERIQDIKEARESFVFVRQEDFALEHNQLDPLLFPEDAKSVLFNFVMVEKEEVKEGPESNPKQDNNTAIHAIFGFFEFIAEGVSRLFRV